MESKIEQINPDEYYSASHVVKSKWFWLSSVLSFTTFLNTEEGQRIFKPIISTSGAVKRYRIKGSSLIEVLTAIDKGDLRITHGQVK